MTNVDMPTIDKIVSAVSAYSGIAEPRLLSRDRHRPIVDYRNIAIYLSREYTKASWVELGKRFDRDHTTAIWAYRSIKANREPHIKHHLAKIIEIVQMTVVDKRAHTVSVGDGIVLA